MCCPCSSVSSQHTGWAELLQRAVGLSWSVPARTLTTRRGELALGCAGQGEELTLPWGQLCSVPGKDGGPGGASTSKACGISCSAPGVGEGVRRAQKAEAPGYPWGAGGARESGAGAGPGCEQGGEGWGRSSHGMGRQGCRLHGPQFLQAPAMGDMPLWL